MGASQPPHATQRITRSISKREPDQVLEVPGPGNFSKPRRQRDPSHQGSPGRETHETVIPPATRDSSQQPLDSAGSKGPSTPPPFEIQLPQELIGSAEVNDTTSSVDWDFIKDTFEPEEDLEAFYKTVGYLPPLNDAVIEALKLILPENMDLEAVTGRISSSNQDSFNQGLSWRNVDIEPDREEVDPQINVLKDLRTGPPSTMQGQNPQRGHKEHESTHASSTEDVAARAVLMQYHDALWVADMQKCKDQTQEAIFQRTVLMSMIDRLNLIYRQKDGSITPPFDYSVETPWTCPPMPTKADASGYKWLTSPLPDLTLAFHRKELLRGLVWEVFPPATKKLICYEGWETSRNARAFPFLTIEAKRNFAGINDPVARSQSLNNASQSLHNMYEIFREADQGTSSHTFRKMFFDKVRFFSVVATPEGVRIRVHRARDLGDARYPMAITDGYPLRFTHTDYLDIIGEDYTYHKVAEELANIVLGYVATILKGSLEEAIKKVYDKFLDYARQFGKLIERDERYYSYGHLPGPSRKRKTPSASVETTSRATSMPPPSLPPAFGSFTQLQLGGDGDSPTSVRSRSQSSVRSTTPLQMEESDRVNKRMKSA